MTKLENLAEILEANPEGAAFLYTNYTGCRKVYMLRGDLVHDPLITSNWTIVEKDQVAQMLSGNTYLGIQNKVINTLSRAWDPEGSRNPPHITYWLL